MQIRVTLILIALLALGAGVVSAQDVEVPAPHQSYHVCDWGLLVVEEPSEPAQYIDIISPADFSGVRTRFTVSGEGRGVFEGNVVVVVLDSELNRLFGGVTTIETTEVGGHGPWSFDVELGPVPEATRIIVRAFADSPADGSMMAEDSINLSANSPFGLPYIDITSPSNGDISGLPLRVEGTAGALFENSFVLEVTDPDGNVLDQTPVTFDAPDIGLSGPWSATLDFTAEPGSTFVIHAYALSMEDGERVVASDQAVVTVDTMRLTFERVLVVQSDDPILLMGEMCTATEGEFEVAVTSPVYVDSIGLVSNSDAVPGVALEVSGQKPSFCQTPFRVRLVASPGGYTGDAYYGAADDSSSICTRDLREFTVRVPLGTPVVEGMSVSINGLTIAID